ncbi:MAG: hypothetical protein QE487_15745 [Fluviicola sp.]|nr:hypothetical protein [Fluviicola sp.]
MKSLFLLFFLVCSVVVCAQNNSDSHKTIPPDSLKQKVKNPSNQFSSDIIVLPAKTHDLQEKRSCYPESIPNEIKQVGIFKDSKLWDGKEYIYDEDCILLKVKIFKNWLYHSDGQL